MLTDNERKIAERKRVYVQRQIDKRKHERTSAGKTKARTDAIGKYGNLTKDQLADVLQTETRPIYKMVIECLMKMKT